MTSPPPPGAVSLRLDRVEGRGDAGSSSVSLAGVSLALTKVLVDNMEPCCPAAETQRPVLTLSTLSLSHCNDTHTLEVGPGPPPLPPSRAL